MFTVLGVSLSILSSIMNQTELPMQKKLMMKSKKGKRRQRNLVRTRNCFTSGYVVKNSTR